MDYLLESRDVSVNLSFLELYTSQTGLNIGHGRSGPFMFCELLKVVIKCGSRTIVYSYL